MSLRGARAKTAPVSWREALKGASPIGGSSCACGQACLGLKPLRLSLVPPNPPDGPEAINGRILNRQLSMHLMRAAIFARKPSSPENCPVFARKSGVFLPTRALRKKRAHSGVSYLTYQDDLASSGAPVKGAIRAPGWFFRRSRRRGQGPLVNNRQNQRQRSGALSSPP